MTSSFLLAGAVDAFAVLLKREPRKPLRWRFELAAVLTRLSIAPILDAYSASLKPMRKWYTIKLVMARTHASRSGCVVACSFICAACLPGP